MFAALEAALIAGFAAFGPKYFENEFNMDASLAGMLFGKNKYFFALFLLQSFYSCLILHLW